MEDIRIDYDAIVIGAGFAGMYMLYRLREAGFRCHGFETGGDVGGTWYWNRYPGARCDVESLDYSYTFDPALYREWEWSERYSAQPEILRYAAHVADRHRLRELITFNTKVTGATFEETSSTWLVRSAHGDEIRCQFLITAAGCLSASNIPDLDGLEQFSGEHFHTGRWPHEGVDLTGKRVGVIGTGSSGIQAIPEIAKTAAKLVVFQRTPNFSLPARNRPLSDREQWMAANTFDIVAPLSRISASGTVGPIPDKSAVETPHTERQAAMERAWAIGGLRLARSFTDTMTDLDANAIVADFVRAKIASIVHDERTARKLLPTDHPIGTKRICADTDYYATYNLDHVELVDLRAEPIERITEHGIRTSTTAYDLDVIVFATGFDAMTGPLTRIDIRGRGGISLRERWKSGPRSYLGLSIVDFPNLFTITGPGSPSVLSNVIRSIEQHVDWIAELLTVLRAGNYREIEATRAAQDEWVLHVNEVADATLYKYAKSWYLGANIAGKAQVFMPYAGGVGTYRQECAAVAEDGYRGFTLGKTPARAPA